LADLPDYSVDAVEVRRGLKREFRILKLAYPKESPWDKKLTY
jgi:hypothetical protein